MYPNVCDSIGCDLHVFPTRREDVRFELWVRRIITHDTKEKHCECLSKHLMLWCQEKIPCCLLWMIIKVSHTLLFKESTMWRTSLLTHWSYVSLALTRRYIMMLKSTPSFRWRLQRQRLVEAYGACDVLDGWKLTCHPHFRNDYLWSSGLNPSCVAFC